ncbi:acyl-CoA synthetase [Meridianimarinicoccus roseus]|uniref:3-methylmercaptopropionyl-CoA ligase n=1 Tax=Meridianimarinicoccus roseus TaxID=2072018 RepID=A0A2V2LEB3_9RHOB|nr:acyl-CoA synthetase [Meridianimarinicoccus roseus]PWR00789.1 acyl-CoA synthetase [Meridianimarinicoccus roseus]
MANIYQQGLDKGPANYEPLTPLAFLRKTALVYPDHPAVVYHAVRRTWAETYARCFMLAGGLARCGIGRGDTVAIVAANIPEMFEAHFGVPMCGAVLNTINTRLDAEMIGFILNHGEAKAVLVDPEFSEVVERAIRISGRDMLVIDIEDISFEGGKRIGTMTYTELLAGSDPDYEWVMPRDDWDPISLNYTSGTTGNPKGVVYHHRGAHLNAVSNIATWAMPHHAVYLWTLPMFHCNGWCFPWTLAANAGTAVCLRAVRADVVFDLIGHEKVTHFCGAPIVMNMLANAPDHLKHRIRNPLKAMTAGAAPPASVIEKMEAMGVEITHVYGLTETYGPSVICMPQRGWQGLPPDRLARLKARQGVANMALDDLMVADPETMQPVPEDGTTIGEIFMRGNCVMKGYLKNPSATEEAFRGGWFASGDLAVRHPDGYVEIKDRSKDIIISGGENISSIEVEDVLYRHPDIMEAAVVARPDERWGETPCAFVTLKDGRTLGADEVIAFCRENMAHYKAPRHVVFGPLPKTSTGKIQKFQLRERAREV